VGTEGGLSKETSGEAVVVHNVNLPALDCTPSNLGHILLHKLCRLGARGCIRHLVLNPEEVSSLVACDVQGDCEDTHTKVILHVLHNPESESDNFTSSHTR
jgi:hypothetical protein